MDQLPEVGSVFTPEEAALVHKTLSEYADVFDPALVPGGARVEPMQVRMKPEWEPEKLQPMRRYAPAVQAAIDKETVAAGAWDSGTECSTFRSAGTYGAEAGQCIRLSFLH